MRDDGHLPYQGYGRAQPHHGPKITQEDRANAVSPLLNKEAFLTVRNRVDVWRDENPNDVKSWAVCRGVVVQFWGMRIYYGRCVDCELLITDRRNVSHPRHRDGRVMIGRWPKYCQRCREKSDATKTRKRQARWRALQKVNKS